MTDVLYHSETSGLSGRMGREWKHHKWTSRYRNQKGKWIYTYGGASTSENKYDEDNKKADENSKRAFDKMITEGQEFLNAAGEWLQTTEVANLINDIGPHKGHSKSKIGQLFETLPHIQIRL